MDIEARPLHKRTGNTFRRVPLRYLKNETPYGKECVLHLSGVSSDTCSALGLPQDDTVPHSLRKRGLWQLCSALQEFDVTICGHPVRLEALCTTPRVQKGPRFAGYKTLQRSGTRTVCSDEKEQLLQVVQPLTPDQLRRRVRTGIRVRRKKPRRIESLELDTWETAENENESSSDEETQPMLSVATLSDFVAPKAQVPVKRRKRRYQPSFPSLHPPLRPFELLEPVEPPAAEPEALNAPEPNLDLEDPVLLRGTRITTSTSQIAPENLQRQFGTRLWESKAAPRRFALDVSPRVRRASGELGSREDEQDLAFLTFEVVREDPKLTELELYVNVRLCTSGSKEIDVPEIAASTGECW